MPTSPIITFEIAGRPVGPGSPCYLIAEVAQAHDGSLGTAHAYVDAAARCGFDAIKFQTHIAAAESTPAEAFRVRFSPQDATRYEYWKRMEFTEEQWAGIAEHCRTAGITFLSTPFSFAAVELLARLQVPAWKVASGEVSNLPMIERMARTGLPVLLSSGLSSWQDLDDAVTCVRATAAPTAVFQCTTSYPCPPERVGLNMLAELHSRYECPVGLSDHSGKIYAGLAAATLGADLLEMHIVFSRDCFGPDVPASLTIDEAARLVEGVRFIRSALDHPLDKDAEARSTQELQALFGKSIVAARPLTRGQVLSAADLALKKPGTGIPARRLNEVVGRVLQHDVAADVLLTEADLG